MVQSLAPVLLAELAKLKSSSSSSSPQDQNNPPSSSSVIQNKPWSSSSARDKQKNSSSFSSREEQKQSLSSLTKGGKVPPLASSSVQGTKKVLVKKSLPTKSEKPLGLLGFIPAHPPLVLSGLPSTVTQAQVFSAVEKFGKTRLISVSQERQEVSVSPVAACDW